MYECIKFLKKLQSGSLEAKKREKGEDKAAGKPLLEEATVALSCKAILGVQGEVKGTGHIEDVRTAM